MNLQTHDLIGMFGGGCILVSYGLLQLNKIQTTSFTYLFLNLIGALLIMYSLLTDWNFTAFISEAIWALISLYALVIQYFATRGTGSENVNNPVRVLYE